MNEIGRLIELARKYVDEAADDTSLGPDEKIQVAQVHALCAIAEAVQKVANAISESSPNDPLGTTRRWPND